MALWKLWWYTKSLFSKPLLSLIFTYMMYTSVIKTPIYQNIIDHHHFLFLIQWRCSIYLEIDLLDQHLPLSCCSHGLCSSLKKLLSPSSLCLHRKHPFNSLDISTPFIPYSNNGQAWCCRWLMQLDMDRWYTLLTQSTLLYHVNIYDHPFLSPLVQQREEYHTYHLS